MTNMRFLAICSLLMISLARAAVAQDSITLRREAVVQAAPITLGDIAELRGNYASSLGGTVIAGSIRHDSDITTISVAQVREALEKQRGVNLGRITLSGASCNVRVGRIHNDVGESDARADQDAAQPLGSLNNSPTADLSTTPRAGVVLPLIEARIAEILGVSIERIRVSFEKTDSDLLATPTDGRVVTITPQAMSDRIPLLVRVYEGERIAASGIVRAAVLVERKVAVAKERLTRGQTIRTEDVQFDTQWLGPSVQPADPAKVIGAAARNRVNPGAVIRASDLESPLTVKKGDQLWVDCISGSVVVQVYARAMENGRDGELVLFTSPGGKKPFHARIDGPGRAVAMSGSGTTDGRQN